MPTPIIPGKANGNSNGSKQHKNGNNGSIDEIDNYELLRLLLEVKEGNFSVRMPGDKMGISGKICDTLNEIISLNETLVEELTKARNTIGKKDILITGLNCQVLQKVHGHPVLILSIVLSPILFIQPLKLHTLSVLWQKEIFHRKCR